MKIGNYYALGLATTLTLFFAWLVAVTIQPANFAVEFVRLVLFAVFLEELASTLR